MMKLKTIALRNFRNIENATVDFSDNINVFIGDNGQGKTNLLESIVILSYGKSFRVSEDRLLIQNDFDFADIRAKIDARTMRVVISDSGKYLSIDDNPVARLSDFIGKLNVVLFQPDDLQFFTQTPKKRRRDIDYEIGKLSKVYMNALSKVMKLIQERNSMLKSQDVDEAYMTVLNGLIAKESVTIIKERYDLVALLTPKINRIYRSLSDEDHEITFSYLSFIKSIQENSETMILKRLSESEKRDRDFRLTHVGVHRDDFIFMVDDIPVVNRLSQGQRRILIVAYKLSLIELIFEKTKVYPVFCMDDLLSELDEKRRSRVLGLIPKTLQCLITTTDLQFLNGYIDSVKIFSVKNGVIEGGSKDE